MAWQKRGCASLESVEASIAPLPTHRSLEHFVPKLMQMILYIAAGSALGGVARYVIGGWVQRVAATPFPVGTLLVNITGSLLLGVLARTVLVTPGMSAEMRALLTIGFCGGYTTFSTFSLETLQLLEKGQPGRAALYALTSVVLSLAALWLGFVIARELSGSRAFPGSA